MLKYFLLMVTIGTLLMVIVMQQTGTSLKTQDTPNGILDLEFASNTTKATAVINAWKKTELTDNIQVAKLNTELDFIFILFYSIFLNLVSKSIAGKYVGAIKNIGLILANGAIAAGVLDIMENIGMLFTLHDYINSTVIMFTFAFSVLKWIIVLSILVYFLAAGSFHLFKKSTNPV